MKLAFVSVKSWAVAKRMQPIEHQNESFKIVRKGTESDL